MKYTYTKNSITVKLGDQLHVVDSTNDHFQDMLKYAISGDEVQLRKLFNKYARVTNVFNDLVTYEYGILYVNLENGAKISVEETIGKRLMRLYDNGQDVKAMLMFLGKLSRNPNWESIKDIYRFMDHNELPITDDGDIIAYKIVAPDYKDIHTGTMDNSVGSIVKMSRNAVEFNREQTCSSGLHFCSKEYLPQYGGFFGDRSNGHVMVLKINPMNIVSIPTDYNNAKGRACEYEVIDEIPQNTLKEFKEIIEKIESNEVITVGKFLDKVKASGKKVLGWIGFAADE